MKLWSYLAMWEKSFWSGNINVIVSAHGRIGSTSIYLNTDLYYFTIACPLRFMLHVLLRQCALLKHYRSSLIICMTIDWWHHEVWTVAESEGEWCWVQEICLNVERGLFLHQRNIVTHEYQKWYPLRDILLYYIRWFLMRLKKPHFNEIWSSSFALIAISLAWLEWPMFVIGLWRAACWWHSAVVSRLLKLSSSTRELWVAVLSRSAWRLQPGKSRWKMKCSWLGVCRWRWRTSPPTASWEKISAFPPCHSTWMVREL